MSKGQSLFEVVIAIFASTLIITVLVALVANSIRNATFSKNKTLAARYAQEATEWLRGQRDADVSAFLAAALSPTYCFKDLSWELARNCGPNEKIDQTPFLREVYFTRATQSGKAVITVEVRVFWDDAQGTHEVRNATNFTDWRER